MKRRSQTFLIIKHSIYMDYSQIVYKVLKNDFTK